MYDNLESKIFISWTHIADREMNLGNNIGHLRPWGNGLVLTFLVLLTVVFFWEPILHSASNALARDSTPHLVLESVSFVKFPPQKEQFFSQLGNNRQLPTTGTEHSTSITAQVDYGIIAFTSAFTKDSGMVPMSTHSQSFPAKLNYSIPFTGFRTNNSLVSGPPSLHLEKPMFNEPSGNFKAWDKGTVSVIRPYVPRNCTKLIEGDKSEIERVSYAKVNWSNAVSDYQLGNWTYNCSWLKEQFSDNLYNSRLERSFPVAYIFEIYDAPQQVFRLLKLLYRPQNSYCIHYDLKSEKMYKQLFDNIAMCFNNIIIASKIENVIWGYYTVMDAHVNCLSDLLTLRESQQPHLQWKYAINLCGKELPLMTTHEIVSRLIPLNGSSSLKTGKLMNDAKEWEIRFKFKTVLRESKGRVRTWPGKQLLPPIPLDLPIYKSLAYSALSYQFVEYLIHDKDAYSMHHYFQDVYIAEEHFFATMYMKPNVPGGYNPKIPNQFYFGVQHAIWSSWGDCHGRYVHGVCIADFADLKLVVNLSSGVFFHNKYFMEDDHIVMDCMEERIVSRNKQEYKEEVMSNG